MVGYPWQNATASLKPFFVRLEGMLNERLSVAKRHGLIEAADLTTPDEAPAELSVAKRHGLIEALDATKYRDLPRGYPWQNATASLKLRHAIGIGVRPLWLSVAKRHGLIEATARPSAPLRQQDELSVAKRHGLIEAR